MEPLTGVMRAPDDEPESWTCGECGALTTRSHFYADDKGIMRHGERPADMPPPPPVVNGANA